MGLEHAHAHSLHASKQDLLHSFFFFSFSFPHHSLIDTLKGPGPFTVFAPTDEAFGKIDPATLQSILEDKAKLTSILTYHVVSGTSRALSLLVFSPFILIPLVVSPSKKVFLSVPCRSVSS